MVMYMKCLGFWTPGPLELIVIGGVALLIFGRKLPEIARNIGKSLIEFKKGMKEVEETKDDLVKDVNEVKRDIVNEAKDATGLNDSETSD